MFKDVYAKLPVFAQNLAVSLQGWRIARRRYGGNFSDIFREYQRRDSWSEEEVFKLRKLRRCAALERASTAPFYRDHFKQVGANWQDFIEDNAFLELPILGKEEVRSNIDDFLPRGGRRCKSFVQTSGTSGAPLKFPVSSNFEAEQWAVWWRYRGWYGVGPQTWCGLFASAPVVHRPGRTLWRVNYPGREVRFSIYHISRATVRRYLEALAAYRISWVHAHASALSLLARCAKEEGLLGLFQPELITVGASNLERWEFDCIAEVFGVPPRQHYGLAEGVANISECPAGSLHVDEDFSYVEFVKNAAGDCEIVGTPFANTAFSLLRYRTGDLALVGEGACQCGRWGRVVRSLDGRVSDFLVLPDGRRLTALSTIFSGIHGLAAAQIYQKSNGELVVRYVPSGGWSSESTRLISARLNARAGLTLPVKFAEVVDVTRTSKGKVRLVISEVV